MFSVSLFPHPHPLCRYVWVLGQTDRGHVPLQQSDPSTHTVLTSKAPDIFAFKPSRITRDVVAPAAAVTIEDEL